jgi:hypothetical protein
MLADAPHLLADALLMMQLADFAEHRGRKTAT